ASAADDVVVGQLPDGVRERRSDAAVPAHLRLHLLRRLAALGREVARADRPAPRRRDPAVRRAALHGRLLFRQLVGAQPLDGDLSLLRAAAGAGAAAARGALLPASVARTRNPEAAGPLPDRLSPPRARPRRLGPTA